VHSAQARAAIFVRLLSLVNGSSRVRLSVVNGLVCALNEGPLPKLPAASIDQAAHSQLADALAGTERRAMRKYHAITSLHVTHLFLSSWEGESNISRGRTTLCKASS
jgi:histidine ammonia-lyase